MSELEKLAALTGMARDVALARLRNTASQRAQIEDLLAALAPAALAPGDNPAAAALHMAWIEQEKTRLNKKLARAHVAEAEQRDAASRAFGRHQALTELQLRQEKG